MSTLTPSRPPVAQEATPMNGDHNGQHNGKPSPQRPRSKRVLWPWVVAVVLLLAVGTAGAFYVTSQADASTASAGLTFEVARGPMVVSVTESGTIQAAEQEILRAEVEGQTTIIYLIPEGTMVEKGDLLVEMDTSEMEDEKLEDTIRVQNAEAAWIRAREELEVAKNQAMADVAQATLDYDFAQTDLEKYKLGDYPNLLTEANNKIKIAEEEERRALDKAQGSKRLRENDFISETELLADQLAAQKAELNLQLARQELDLLKQYDYTRQIKQLESDVEQARLALERAERKASADVVQAEAELRAKESELARSRDRLERITYQLSKAKIFAPRAGLVVYATSVQDSGWRGNDEPLEAGQQVRERQELIYLPTAKEMIAEIKIHESSLEKVRVGMPVRITIDALPGKQYWGEVTKIAPLPDAGSRFMNPDLKVYNTTIKVLGEAEELRTGMSCRAEIIVETYDDATYVPVQSIVRVSGVPTAFVVADNGKVEQREVEIGQDNNRMVVIESGLEAGEQVLLAPPLGDTGTVETLRAEDIPSDQKEKVEEAQDNPPVVPQDDSAAGPGGPDMGGPGAEGGRGARGSNPAMGRLMQQVNEKATAEEQKKLGEYFQNQDFAGGRAYLEELAAKYEIELPQRPQAGQRPEGAETGAEDGAGRGAERGAMDNATGSAEGSLDQESDQGSDQAAREAPGQEGK